MTKECRKTGTQALIELYRIEIRVRLARLVYQFQALIELYRIEIAVSPLENRQGVARFNRTL